MDREYTPNGAKAAAAHTGKQLEALQQQREELIVQAEIIKSRSGAKHDSSQSEIAIIMAEIWDIDIRMMHCGQSLI
jgi:hypothetical protein